MKGPVFCAAGLGAVCAVVIGLAACSGHNAAAPPASTASPSADYSALLIKASDIIQPADFFTNAPPTGFTAGAPTSKPNGKPGVAGVFKSQDGSRQISDTVLVLTDEAAAKSALGAAVAGVGGSVSFPTPQTFSVGDNGTLFSGVSPDQSKSVTVVLFTQGKAFITLEFDGAQNDPVAVDFVNDVAQKQDAAIKAGLSH
ncbi:hypothetical protein [Mycobacterium sp.]|uniref:hypothetical protein n=1 Tax=Mycobacterium sp. TaxID=1785 RepID=UPI003F9B8FA9